MIDQSGYRLNVGMVLINKNRKIFLGKRKKKNTWQMPQGGIEQNENPEDAMIRELNEELGLLPCHINILTKTKEWLYYEIPQKYRNEHNSIYRGQKQIWYLLEFIGDDSDIDFSINNTPEFDSWKWVEYWFPIYKVVVFKRRVYRNALLEFHQYLHYYSYIKEKEIKDQILLK